MTSTFARRITILNQYGVCARPAALFVKTAARYEADVTVTKGDNSVSGKSIMGLMTLEASQGTTVEVRAAGPQAKEVIEALTNLVNDGFSSGEGCLPIPKEHSEWLVVPPPPPAPPPFRIMRVAFSLGSEASQERECLVRAILPSLRRHMLPRRARVRGLDLRKGKEQGAVPGGPEGRSVAMDDLEPPRPFFLLLSARDAWRFQSLDVVPNEVSDLRGFIGSGPDDYPLSHEEISTLVRCYPWSNDSGRYVLKSGLSREDAVNIDKIFHRRNGYLREHCLVLLRVQSAGPREALRSTQPKDMSDLMNHLTDHGWKHAGYADIQSFEVVVRSALGRWLEEESHERTGQHNQSTASEQRAMPELTEIGRRLASLTPRERQAARLIAAGQSSRQIAAKLGIAVMTAETHRVRIRDKLKAHSLADLQQMLRRDGTLLGDQTIGCSS